MESRGSRNSVISIPSRRPRSTSPTGTCSPPNKKRSAKKRSAPKRKGNPTTLPVDVLKHVASFLHPVNTVALRQTSTQLRDTVKRHPTKENALRSKWTRNTFDSKKYISGLIPVSQNRFVMKSSGRRYMKHDDAKKYLEKMFTNKNFRTNLFAPQLYSKSLIFPGMYGTVPTDRQRLALAQAITSDNSKQGIEFMYRLIKRIVRGHKLNHEFHTLSPRSMASMYSKKGPGRRKVF